MKKKIISYFILVLFLGVLSFPQNAKGDMPLPVESYGKQYWAPYPKKICCDLSDPNKPCSASTSDCPTNPE